MPLPSSTLRLLSLPFAEAVANPLAAARLAADAGLSGVLLDGPLALATADLDAVADDIAEVRAAAGRCFVSIALAPFPIDHPLVEQCPDRFAIRRDNDATVIDPRRLTPAAGMARARLNHDDAADVFATPLLDMIDRLIAAGVDGLRLTDTAAPALIAALAARCEQRGVVLLGDAPLAGAAGTVIRPGQTAPATGPIILEIAAVDTTPPASITVAATVADGLVVAAAAARRPAIREALDRAIAGVKSVGDIGGSVRRLSAPGSAIEIMARGDGERIVCAIANLGDVPIAPNLAGLLQPLGVAFAGLTTVTGDAAADAPLAPGAARIISGHRARPIIEPVAVAGDPLAARDWPRLVIDDVEPTVAGGDFAVKRVVGDTVTVSANVYTDGHEPLGVELRWRAADESDWHAVPMAPLGNDRFEARFTLERLGSHRFAVEGWLDRFGGFRRDYAKKRDAGVAQGVDAAEGLALVAAAAERAGGDLGAALERWRAEIDAETDPHRRGERLMADELAVLMARADDRPHALTSPEQRVDAERLAARFSSWYELFPRSATDDKARHGTFADVINRLPAIRDMGFDTLYFPPIHPIGTVNRKGPNNTLTPGPDDVGSPYAIGSAEGGHEAIHPALGSFDDFDRLVTAARDHGLEIALDFAIQCAPDHPWLKEHPGWFAWRPDGSMKYAENPPKKYQDIVNVDFYGPDAVPDLWLALRDVVLLWIGHGVKTFRVDNPHTKPLPFWEWMIRDVRARHPDVIFLAEAFTRPNMMYRLAKVGFSQSYTYFTWRDGKQELIDYVTELTTTAPRHFYRPHLFVNTPDINPFFLQTSGRPGFRIRAALAATLSGLFGVYSGFELCESAPLGPGKEEYLDSEKYEIRPRDYQAPGNIIADITLLNRLRRTYPALQTHLNTRFYVAHDDNIIWYGKPDADGGAMIMVMINLDPHHPHECDFEVPLWEFGLGDDGAVAVEDLAHGQHFDWHGKVQHIRLAPDEPYRLWRLSPKGNQ
jgi:starch synthase (maltosyl-transferring)